mmetsp:Transcript_28822/g.67095  ORF Transcript_28822/g.67095 Transcript_28822/m.67095 type:complete len:179 (+) Transcript_28822:57-593(+)|eukprot:CAMPEP_0178431334 /NCGR_PEP_ID=MMETSP0689_2-20121128/31792_1 /TAXON_ID=160604 /ORGANISM="Amphidinium massartii, Strain CS-259" /LENGTH=178 /DNA_ID=CAMNT_0020053239 /DNA_START=57 /DNA_END=593 /DNA_ORIENTATION=+
MRQQSRNVDMRHYASPPSHGGMAQQLPGVGYGMSTSSPHRPWLPTHETASPAAQQQQQQQRLAEARGSLEPEGVLTPWRRVLHRFRIDEAATNRSSGGQSGCAQSSSSPEEAPYRSPDASPLSPLDHRGFGDPVDNLRHMSGGGLPADATLSKARSFFFAELEAATAACSTSRAMDST